MENKGLTLTVVMLGQSMNYGEGLGNITSLKKLTRHDGYQYTYLSRQALRYSLTKCINWQTTPVCVDQKVVQFAPSSTILDYPEIDLFGYMKTVSKKEAEKMGNTKGGAFKRSAVARLSDAISLEPFHSDLDFLTNMGLASRIGAENAIAQSEQHLSYYSYTLTLDLNQVGIDGELEISATEKANRVVALLEGIEFLNRDIKGRNENLNPLFLIGGIYPVKNSFFKDRVRVSGNAINVETLKELKDAYDWLSTHTHVGVVTEVFNNDAAIKNELNATSVSQLFATLKQEVRDYYGQ